MEEMLRKIITKLDTLEQGQQELKMEVRTDFEAVHKKLDIISAQVAHNTEQEVRLNDVIARVDQLETDVKVIKKAISNQ